MANFDILFNRLMEHEGGYINHPSDPGGETMYGITKAVAVANGYAGAIGVAEKGYLSLRVWVDDHSGHSSTPAKDNATSGIVDEWTDQAEERAWFLFEASRKGRG